MSTCIRIVKEDNSSPYLYYEQSGYWNIEFIAKKSNASGYIVQKVKLINTTTISDIEESVHYYEAWRVINGKCIDDENDIPDDTFKYGCEEIRHILIKKSLGKKGEIKYLCEIYWIDETDIHFKIVDKWKEGGVVYARKLKSVLVEECPELDEKTPVCIRTPFIHKVNFVDRNTIKVAMIECFSSRIKGQDPSLQNVLKNILNNTPYESLVGEICVKNNLPYDRR